MKKKVSLTTSIFSVLVSGTLLFSSLVQAEESGEAPPEMEGTTKNSNSSAWLDSIQKKYEFTDEQMKTLKESGLNDPEMAKVAQLSKSSSKPIAEILVLRNEKKMGWGKIAKELGVHPGELGRAVSSLKHERLREHRREHRESKVMEQREKFQQRQMERGMKASKEKHH